MTDGMCRQREKEQRGWGRGVLEERQVEWHLGKKDLVGCGDTVEMSRGSRCDGSQKVMDRRSQEAIDVGTHCQGGLRAKGRLQDTPLVNQKVKPEEPAGDKGHTEREWGCRRSVGSRWRGCDERLVLSGNAVSHG